MYNTTSNDEYRKLRKTTVGFHNWAGMISGQEFIFIINMFLTAKIFTELSLLKVGESEAKYHSKRVTRYLYSGKKDTLIEIIISECNSILDAHESILDFILGSMMNKIPTGEEKATSVGDISFVGYGENILSITFARDNIMAIVRSVGNVETNVISYATRIDHLILSKDEQTKSSNAPVISSFNISSTQITLGEKTRISFSSVDPRNKSLMYKIFSTAGPISMHNDELFIEAKKVGNHVVKLYAINENGLASTSELRLQVS
jgi:hypothetical protein